MLIQSYIEDISRVAFWHSGWLQAWPEEKVAREDPLVVDRDNDSDRERQINVTIA